MAACNHIALIFTVLQAILLTDVKCGEILEFQKNNIPTNTSLAVKYLSPLPDGRTSVSRFSLCLWFKVYYFRGKHAMYPLSYATSLENNNDLSFGVSFDKIQLAYRGYYKKQILPESLWVNKWHHFCAVVSSNETYSFYFNGKFLVSGKSAKFKLPLNGSFVIGQEQDDVEGGLNTYQSFSGQIAELNIYSKLLTEKEVEGIYHCNQSVIAADILSWSDVADMKKTNVQVIEIKEDNNFCIKTEQMFEVVPETSTTKKASIFCQKLHRSTIYTPRNSLENEVLVNVTLPLIEQCRSVSHATGYFWLGAHKSNDKWVDRKGHDLTYQNFKEGNKGTQSCVNIVSSPNIGIWDDAGCLHEFCFSCVFKKPVLFTLRGICSDHEQEAFFFMDNKMSKNNNIRGIIKYQISIVNGVWQLENMWTQTVLATFFSSDHTYPIGSLNWTIKKDFVLCNKKQGTQHLMTLSTCSSEEYICNDASCIPIHKRCDLRVDCPDSSDETNCSKLKLPPGYLKDLPPPGVNTDFLYLEAKVVIHSLSEINHKDMQITIDMSLTLTWRDLRVEYSNLKPIIGLNILQPEDVWTPEIDFIGADFPNIHKQKPFLWATKLSEPQPDKLEMATKDEMFDGSQNPLNFHQRIKAPYSCNMDLSNFPFDVQKCFIKIKESHGTPLVRWKSIEVEYEGEERLTEYDVHETKSFLSEDHHWSIANIRIHLSRRFSYYLTSAYIPISMLMFISFASLFCGLENLDLRVMMSVTTLIVLYTLYQQISDGLPKTSYSKALDIWCFFSLCIIFSQIVFHVILEVDFDSIGQRFKYTKDDVQIDEDEELNEERNSVKKKNSKNFTLVLAAKYMYVVVFIGFSSAYWTVVLYRWSIAQEE